jgi:CRP/FNR family cyclic AMP-dependent transcriptional regulator
MTLKDRFTGDRRSNLVEALKRQELLGADAELIEKFVAVGALEEYQNGERIITQGAADNDVYFIVAGNVGIIVNGNNVATRSPGQTVGEMAAVEPTQLRAATVVALESVVALKVPNADFSRLAEVHPKIWKPLARELSRRLLERNKLIETPHESPSLFVISSVEGLDVAREIQRGLDRDVLATVWTDGVFFAGEFTLESLESAVDDSDFAVAIAQPDDIVVTKGKPARTLRDNVLFELGLFMGRLSRHRTFLVHPRVSDLKLPTDLHGLTALSYEQCKPEELTARLGQVCTEIRKRVRSLGVRKVIE